MATEYNDNRQTIGISNVIGAEEVPPDVIDGWRIRSKDSNNIHLNGLIPFVQLIGLYNEEQINRLTSSNIGERRATFVDNSGQEITWDEESGGPSAESIQDDQIRFFENKIRSKYIWLDFEGYNGTDLPAGHRDHIPGILLATNYSQVGSAAYDYYAESGLPRDSGGVGITDLSMETGTKEFGNRRYKVRMTVTNPEILNDQAEYLKLTSLQSSFLLIYGWSNPDSLEGWDYDPPPRITHVGAEGFPNGRMSIDLRQENTGGAWFASTVATTMFDFAFNEVGQLEASFTFMPREISFLSTYRVPVVAENMKLFLGTGEQTDPYKDGEQKSTIFAGLAAGFGAVAGEFGRNLADVIYDEQMRYAGNNPIAKGLFDSIDVNFDASAALRDFSETLSEWGEGSDIRATIDQQKRAEGTFRFPYGGPGIRTYLKTIKTVANPENIDARVQVSQYNSKIAYYYLGWVLEAMRFSLWDMNKDRVRNGSIPFDVKFRYRGIPADSHYNLAFQDTLRGAVLPNQSGFATEAIKQFRLKCIPPKRLWDVTKQELNFNGVNVNIAGQTVSGGDDTANDVKPLTQYDIENEPALNGTYVDPEGVEQHFYEIMGDLEEERFKNWESLDKSEKLSHIPGAKQLTHNQVKGPFYKADYRRSLVTDRSETRATGVEGSREMSPVVRIMHPDFEGQILYHFTWRNWLYVELGLDRKHNACPLYSIPNWESYPSQADAAGNRFGGFVYSKLKNFFFGEIRGALVYDDPKEGKVKKCKANGQLFGGIICPAISARYFNGTRYQRCQQRWFNKHLNFLYDHFEPLIRNKIMETVSRDGNLNQIDGEPIDLLWLTGRKYRHPLPSLHFGVSYGATYGAGAVTPAYGTEYRDGGINWTPRDAIYNMDEIDPARIVMATAEDEESLNQRETVAAAQRDELNVILNGPVNGSEQIEGNPYFAQASSRLVNVDNTLDELDLKTIRAVEDRVVSIEKEYRGLEGELNFWQGRVSNILAELYNKDLVTFSDTSIEIDPSGDGDQPRTKASIESVPYDTLYTAMTSDGEEMDVPVPRGEAAQRYKIAGTTATTFGNLQPNPGGYELLFLNDNPESADDGHLIDEPEGLNFEQMEQAQIKRYVKVNFQPDNRWQLNLNNIEEIGDIKIELGFAGPGLNYIYMNFLVGGAQERYTSAVELNRATQFESVWADQLGGIFEEAKNSYSNFIEKRRGLLRNYLETIEQLEYRLNAPRAGYETAVDEVLSIQQKRIEQQDMILATQENMGTEISPFSGSNPLDQVAYWAQGGGRYMRLNGVAAQQWALRFSKRIVYGAGDVKNYKPNKGGVPIIIPDKKVFGWPELPAGVAVEDSVYDIHQDRTDGRKLANLAGWNGQPKSILDVGGMGQALTYVWKDIVYDVRGIKGAPENWIKPPGVPDLQMYGQPGALLWQHESFTPQRMYWAPDEVPARALSIHDRMDVPAPRVIDLVRAGFVDTELIKQTMRERWPDRPEFDSIGFFPDDEGALVKISGRWPSMSAGDDGEPAAYAGYEFATTEIFGAGIDSHRAGPARMIDQDLDFVFQVKDLLDRAKAYGPDYKVLPSSSAGRAQGVVGLHGNDWVKGTIGPGGSADFIFAPVPEGPDMAYPGTDGQPLAEGDHLPEMPYEVLRQVQVATRAVDHARAGNTTYDQETWYHSAGRQPFNREFPYGIPPGRREFVATGSWDYVAGTPGSEETAAEVANSGMEAGWVPGSGSNYDTPRFGMCVNDILNTLPPVFERGFFSSVKYANVNFEGGTPLNKGVEEYIVSSFINLFNAGRRIGISEPNKSLGNLKRDPTYWDLYNNLKPDDDDDEGSSGLDLSTMSMADFSNQKVQNVAEIPIRRDVVDNLLNRKNHNMSLLQFTQQILAPSAIGLNGNIQLGVRYTNGVIDIIPASISYKGITTDMLKSAVDSRGQNDEKPNHLLFDYKKRNSLIESVDMSSKMDPAAFLTYQNSSDLLKGRDYNVLKLLSYEGVAEDFKEFLDNTPKADDSGENYSGVITIDNNTGEVKVNKVRFEEVPSSVIDGIISANPERWARITAMMQGNNNFTTELLAFYMRGVTLIIHGTTHISPFNLINVTGVLPDLEGIYVVTNITEKVTPTSFQTILEGKLLRRKREGSGEFI